MAATPSPSSPPFRLPLASQLRLLPPDVSLGYNGLSNTDHVSLGVNTSLEHYLKVVHTSYEISSTRTIDTFQYTVNNNNYEDGDGLASAVFSYDISPMQVARCMRIGPLACSYTLVRHRTPRQHATGG